MEALILEPSVQTPTVKFNGMEGFFEIIGKSNPENAIAFYKQIFEWIDQYVKMPAPLTNMNIRLEYFNTSSSKCLLTILKKIQALHESGHEVVINWYCDKGDVDMLEAAKDYESLVEAPFKIIETTNMS
jgi:hypothetical protein